MPDFAPDYTPRYRLRYTSAGVDHNLTVRGYRGETSLVVGNRARTMLFNLFTAINVWLPDNFGYLSAEYTPEDSSIGTPDSLPAAVVGLAPIANFSDQDRITSLGFVGRSSSTPARLYVFGFQFQPDAIPANFSSDFRINAGESAAITNAIAALNGSGIAANNNLAAAWYNYANIKVNDFWLRQVRRGAL